MCRADQRQNGLDDRLADGRPGATQPLRRNQIVSRHGRLRPGLLCAGRVETGSLSFRLVVGIVDVDLHQEAVVKLSFRQGVSAFLLKRVLGGEHVEGSAGRGERLQR